VINTDDVGSYLRLLRPELDLLSLACSLSMSSRSLENMEDPFLAAAASAATVYALLGVSSG